MSMQYHHAQLYAAGTGMSLKESMDLLSKLPDMTSDRDETEVDFKGGKIIVVREIRASGTILIECTKKKEE